MMKKNIVHAPYREPLQVFVGETVLALPCFLVLVLSRYLDAGALGRCLSSKLKHQKLSKRHYAVNLVITCGDKATNHERIN